MSETESSGLIEDPHKAEEMAYAEKPFRDAVIKDEKERRKRYSQRLDEIKELVEAGRYDDIPKYATDSENFYADIETDFNKTARDLSPLEVAKIAKNLVEENSWRTHLISRRDFNDTNSPKVNRSYWEVDPENPNEDRYMLDNLHRAARDLIGRQKDTGDAEEGPGWYMNPHAPFPRPSDEIPHPYIRDIPKSELDKPPIDPSRTFIGDLAAEEAGKKYDDIQELKRMFKQSED